MAESRRNKRRTGDRIEAPDLCRRVGLPPLAVEEQAALISAIFACSPDGMAFLDPKLIIRAANESFALQMHVSLEEIVGNPADKVMPGWWEQVGHMCQEVRHTGNRFKAEECPYVYKDQPERGVTYWDYTVSPVYGDDGTVLGYLLLQREVTERKRAQEELSRLAAIVESSDDAIIGKTLDGIITTWNAGAERLYGYKASEVIGKPVSILAPPDRAGEITAILDRINRGERVEHFDTVRVRKDGRRIDVSVTVSPIKDPAGRTIGASTIARDVTERKRMEEALRKARDEMELRVREWTAELTRVNERLREVNQQLIVTSSRAREQAELAWRRASELEATIKNIADGVFLCDEEGRIVDVNEAGLRLIGLTKTEEILGPLAGYLALLQLRNAEGRPIATEDLALSRALRGEIVVGYEEIAKSLQTGRDIYLLVSAAPIRDREGKITGAVEVMSDITRIRELDKLKDQFIVVAAHELKTPVAIMKGYAQALLRSAQDLPAPRRKMLDSIDRGANRIDRIVKDLLDISRLHIGYLELAMERINLPELVEDVADRMALTTTKHRIQVVKAEPVVVRGDRDRLEQVLVNLLDNAIKYSPKGGDIDVAVDVRDHEAVVSVRDHGVGIPEERQEHIFERFYSAHLGTPYDYGGMGVGLYISKEIITRHGGRMWFESEEGKGSTFYFSLPLYDEVAKP